MSTGGRQFHGDYLVIDKNPEVTQGYAAKGMLCIH